MANDINAHVRAQFHARFDREAPPPNVRRLFARRAVVLDAEAAAQRDWLLARLPRRVLAFMRFELEVLTNAEYHLMRWVRYGGHHAARHAVAADFARRFGRPAPCERLRCEFFGTPAWFDGTELEMIRWLHRNLPRSVVAWCWGLSPVNRDCFRPLVDWVSALEPDVDDDGLSIAWLWPDPAP